MRVLCDCSTFCLLPHFFQHISAKCAYRTFFRINWHFRCPSISLQPYPSVCPLTAATTHYSVRQLGRPSAPLAAGIAGTTWTSSKANNHQRMASTSPSLCQSIIISLARGPIYKISYDLVYDCRKFIARWTYTIVTCMRYLLTFTFLFLAIMHHEETRELAGERDNARNNARCTQARKATHGLDGQHQDVDRTLRGRVNQSNRGQR